MSSAHEETGRSIPAHLLRQIDEICDQYESQWRAGGTPDIDAYLSRVSEDGRPALLGELLGLEAGYRKACGEAIDAKAYLERYPCYADVVRQALRERPPGLGDDTPPSRCAAPNTLTGADASLSRAASSRPCQRDEIPLAIGKYRVVSLLGRGGQADVFRAIHPALNKDVVIKIARRSISGQDARSRQLQVEGRALAQVEHPHLARVYDFEFHQGRPYLVMEYVQGRTLRQYVQCGQGDLNQRLQLLCAVCRAASAAHSSGIAHLDIKPENIIVDDAAKPWLIDFGLAQLNNLWTEEQGESGVAGTPAYMAPEQARGESESVDHRSDIFALGGILYFLLVGNAPFQGASVSHSLARARDCDLDIDALKATGIPPQLAKICLRALRRDPGERFASADDLALALEGYVGHTKGRRKAKRLLLVSVAAIILLLVAGVLWPRRHFDLSAAHPKWDREARELRLDGQVVRRVRSLSQGTNIVPVLDAFEKQCWPSRIAYPFPPPPDTHRVSDAIRSLNTDLKLIRFRADSEGTGIQWEPVRRE